MGAERRVFRPLRISLGLACLVALLSCTSGRLFSAVASWEPVSLSVGSLSRTGLVVTSSPLRFSGYRLQTSADLAHWEDTVVVFSPAQNTYLVTNRDAPNLNFRLEADA